MRFGRIKQKDVRSAWIDGVHHFHGGSYEDAIAAFAPALEAEGEDVTVRLSRFYAGQAHRMLGVRMLRGQRPAAAADHFQEAMRLNPRETGLAEYLAGCFIRDGQSRRADRLLDDVVKAHPNRTGTLIKLALLRCRQGEMAGALDLAVRAVDTAPDDARLRYCYGLILAQGGQYERAAKQFTEAIAADDTHVEAYAQLGLVRAVMGDMAGAAAALAVAHRQKPEDARIATELSLATAAMNQKTDADGVAQPLSIPAPAERAAGKRLGTIIEAEPEYIDALLSLPASEMDRTIFGEILAILQQAVAEHPEYADMHYYLGRVLARLGRIDAAIHAGEDAVGRNPRYVAALILLGELYSKTEQHQPAIRRLEEAIAAGAAYPDVHYLLGNLYRAEGDLDRAALQYRTALAINRNYKPAAEALASLAA